nr:glycoside hydrolase family 2 TIM barrel-domain containing protein [Hyphomonas sp. Mor2]
MLPLPLSHLLNPTLLELGRLPARANLKAFPDADALAAGDSPWRVSMDGTWAFHLAPSPERVPERWQTEPIADDAWRDIQVPGVWTRQDTGDFPHYANWQMPWDCPKPPEVPAENPTGLYRRDFELPRDWQARSTVLHIGGFESLALVWCNGQFVGMGKDSRLPSEFDLTPTLKAGTNQLALMVVRWCDATWIEDQDHWNHGGLHRSVFLESRAPVHVQDLIVDTDFDPAEQTGSATVRVEVAGGSAGYRARAVLEDPGGKICAETACLPVEQFDVTQPTGAQWAQSYSFKSYAAELQINIGQAVPWSAEHPARYRLITELLDPDGHVAEVHETPIGFTRITVSDRRLKVNGRPIVLIGVNRHDHHPENGKTCSVEDIRAELHTMKRHNINAIRTAHYPNDPVLLDLADELGFYVIDEANVECHARWSEVAQHPGYRAAIFDRTVRMIARDRNHPCIIGWSLGNEAGHGPAHDAAAAAARHLDPGRFVHYEGAVSLRLSFPFGRSPESTQQMPSARERAATDVVCPMYPPIDHIVDWAHWAEQTESDDRPLLLCEFSHAMGNSNGSLTDYVDAFFKEPALAGGFVWDWRDQGLAETDAEGRFYWAYGGHFGDTPNDANFNINGLVGPDGVPHPALREYMWAARPFVLEFVTPSRMKLRNRRVFADSSDVELDWVLLRNGEPIEEGTFWPEIAAGEADDFDLPISVQPTADAEWHLDVKWRHKHSTPWAPEGHIVAWDQATLVTPEAQISAPPALSGRVSQPLQTETIEHAALSLALSEDGQIGSVNLGSDTAIISPFTPTLWRPPTDNDGGKPGARPLFQNRTAEWVGYGLNALQPGELRAERFDVGGEPVLRYARDWRGADGAALVHETLISFPEGRIRFDETLIVPEPWKDVARVGLRFLVAAELDQLHWFGLGPDESYPDRKGAQTCGIWRSTVADQYHPYVRPQEYGAHEDTRWFRLLNEQGEGLQIALPKPLSFTARPHHVAALNDAETLAELQPGEATEVHIDVAMRGLGTAACGPDTLAPYRVGPGTYQFTWTLERFSRAP